MLEVRDLRAPKDVRDSEDRAADRATLFLKSRLKRLSDDKAEKIEAALSKFYEAWKKQTDTQRKRLVAYAELLEGVVEDTTMPFEGASNVTMHYAAGMARTFRATFNKTAYSDEAIFYPVLSPELRKKLGDKPEALQMLEESFNHSFSKASNGLATLKEGTVPCVRDGTLVVSGYWRREVRRCFDQRTYRTVEAFQQDYPDAASAFGDGEMAVAQYGEIIDFFLAHGDVTPEDPEQPELVVGFEYDHVFKNEPEYRVGPWAKFVRYPLTSRAIGDCRLYGYEVQEDREDLKLKRKRGEYYERGVNKCLDSKGEEAGDAWDKSMGFVEGITPAQDPEGRPVSFVDGVCLLDVDGDGVPEKYLVRFCPSAKALLSLVPHRLRRGIDASVPFRMIKRENRLDGVSLIGDCEDLFNQVDTNVRHRNNVRILTTSPIFLGNDLYKESIDLGRAENVIRPGVTYWVKDVDKAFKQMPVQDLSTSGDGMDELRLLKEHVELVFGPTQAQSGRSTPTDPRAPASKTALLMQQSSGRIDDYLDQFMESLPDLGALHAALLFQHADGPTLKYSSGDHQAEIPLELLADPGLRWGAKRRSVQLTPEYAMTRLAHLQALWLGMLPRIMVMDPVAIELWNRQVVASGEPQAEKFLLSKDGETLKGVMQSMQASVAMAQQGPGSPQHKGKEAYFKEVGKGAGKMSAGGAAGQNGARAV